MSRPACDGIVEGRAQHGQLALPPHERRARLCARLLFRDRIQVERTVLTQDRLVQLAELPTWLDAEALDECMPRRLVGLECLCLAFRAVEGEHQLSARPLSQRIVGDECIELADHGGMTARLQIVFDALLEAHEALFLETRDLCLREPLEREIGKRRAAPERQGVVELPLRHEPLEAVEIELAVRDHQEITGRPGLHALPAEQLAQVRDVHVQSLAGRHGRGLAPERVDQEICRDNPVRVQEQRRQQCPLLGPRDLDRPLAVAHLERPEHSVAHGYVSLRAAEVNGRAPTIRASEPPFRLPRWDRATGEVRAAGALDSDRAGRAESRRDRVPRCITVHP